MYIESPTYEEAMKQKLVCVRFDEPQPGTFLPLDGEEIGVPHHYFAGRDPEDLRKLQTNLA